MQRQWWTYGVNPRMKWSADRIKLFHLGILFWYSVCIVCRGMCFSPFYFNNFFAFVFFSMILFYFFPPEWLSFPRSLFSFAVNCCHLCPAHVLYEDLILSFPCLSKYLFMVSMFLGSHADYQIAIFCLSLCTVYVNALDYVFCDILPFASEGSFVMQLEQNDKLRIPAAYKNTQTMIH